MTIEQQLASVCAVVGVLLAVFAHRVVNTFIGTERHRKVRNWILATLIMLGAIALARWMSAGWGLTVFIGACVHSLVLILREKRIL